MFKKKVSIWVIPLVVIATVSLTLIGVAWGLQKVTHNAAGAIQFLFTLGRIHSGYVGEYTDKKLFEGAMHGMVESLDDPYSEYLDAEAFTHLNEMTDGTFGGIGVVLGQRNKEFVVVSPMEGSPGAKAGIEAGDKILKVNDTDTKGRTLEDVVRTIRGKKGTNVKLLLEHKNGEQFTADIVRDDIKIQSVAGKMLPDSKIGYIRIAMFNENTGEEFKKAYEKLEQEGMQATLLDLRHNPGGLLNECVKVSNYIVPKGPVVSITDKQGNTKVYESKLEKVKYPLAVLIDNGSASASEIVSGAVQDTKAGKLFGVKTYGKGCVQSIFHITPETGLKLTTAMYYTPSGRSIHKVGVSPDVEIELPEKPTSDVQLKKAEEYLREELAKKE
ncbi:MAG: S41 family peptidase [Acidaminococcaceae bacterium]|nr:S41 family peptidase [Acidaminococcaceae bacterium]MBO5606243.1 S41 family peptidase [Acidaminococcaceae bacterium]MBO6265716.1 S41 family peptidase [Acidaminococcaceae bacterium]MBP3265218.1 S41 family peptidase [Acidaminococcaceae bacterium]MBQ5345530.1 S41 family peptidase [Acidaminococcaceae bacterium]